MGGDGGTLNNSRQDHVRLRREINGSSNGQDSETQRASVTECALSNEPLRPPHIVVDMAGQLYNKDSLISFLLERRQRGNESEGALSHLRSMKYDTVSVCVPPNYARLTCPVTLKEATEEGHFTVGWKCGCVTAPVRGVPGVETTIEDAEKPDEELCISCRIKGPRVQLGLTLKERLKAIEKIEQSRRARKSKKRKLPAVKPEIEQRKASRKVLNHG